MKTNHRTLDRKALLENIERLDELPTDLRQSVCFAARVWDPSVVANIYRDAIRSRGKVGAARWLIASIEAGDESDVIDYAIQYQMKYGQPLPHLAAEATILRFQPPINGHVARHKPRLAPWLRAAWISSERLMPKEDVDENAEIQEIIDPGIMARFANLDFASEVAP